MKNINEWATDVADCIADVQEILDASPDSSILERDIRAKLSEAMIALKDAERQIRKLF